jgi:hypothetical protein
MELSYWKIDWIAHYLLSRYVCDRNFCVLRITLCWAHHEGTLGVTSYLRVFFISTLDGDEWSILRSGRFVPGEVALSIHRMEGWVFPQLIWALCGRQKILAIVGNQMPIRRSSVP